MKKYVLLLIFIFGNIAAQNQTDTVVRVDTITIERFITNTRTETLFVPQPETLVVFQSRTDTVFRSIPQEPEDIGEIRFGFFKKLSLSTFIYILLFCLLGYLASRLINYIRKLLERYDRWSFLQNILALSDVIVWFLVLLLIIHLIFAAPNLITFFLIITFVVFVGISSVPIIKNIIGGFYIIIKKPFVAGSYVAVKNIRGAVEKVEWRATTIINNEGGITKVPNFKFLVNPFDIIDAERKEKIITIPFSFPLDSDTKTVMGILRESAISSPFSYPKRPPQVFLHEIDYLNKQKKYKLNVFIFDSKYENDLISSVQRFVNEKIETNEKSSD